MIEMRNNMLRIMSTGGMQFEKLTKESHTVWKALME